MLQTHQHDGVTEIRLHRPPVNALNLELVDALISECKKCIKNKSQAIVLTGNGSVFSAGLDVPDLLQHSRNQMFVFWERFFALLQFLWTSPVPVVAAINGHAPAGGAVIALHCDYRLAAAGDFQLGLNEVQVGLPVPASIFRVLRHLVGYRQATLLVTSGRMLLPQDAVHIGMVDEVVAADQVVERALTWLQPLLQLPPVAMNATRLAARTDLGLAMISTEDVRVMTDYWFSDETQATMQRLVDQLGRK